jgi:hypothetical protein
MSPKFNVQVSVLEHALVFPFQIRTVSGQFCVSLIQVILQSPSVQYSKFPHEILLDSQQVSLVVALLTFRLQTGWLHLGISSTVDKTVIPL